jgi:DHA1 family tetracycline resistance protein-like MFS transporter
MIYAIVCFGAFAGIAGPAIQALITRHVSPNEQGGVQGAMSSLTSLANICAPIGAWSFAAGIAPDSRLHMPGVAFFEAAALVVAGLLLAWRTVRVDARLVHGS